MNVDWQLLLAALLAGLVLGLVHYGGLWLTVKRMPSSSHPLLWYFSSMLGRTAFVLAGFFLILPGGLACTGVALAGMLGTRVALAAGLSASPVNRNGKQSDG
jgi:F1F0 ATPase subunit 2